MIRIVMLFFFFLPVLTQTALAQPPFFIEMHLREKEKGQRTETLPFDSIYIQDNGSLLPLKQINEATFVLYSEIDSTNADDCLLGCLKFKNKYYPFGILRGWYLISDTLYLRLYRSTGLIRKSYGVGISLGNVGYSRAVKGCKSLGLECLEFDLPGVCKDD